MVLYFTDIQQRQQWTMDRPSTKDEWQRVLGWGQDEGKLRVKSLKLKVCWQDAGKFLVSCFKFLVGWQDARGSSQAQNEGKKPLIARIDTNEVPHNARNGGKRQLEQQWTTKRSSQAQNEKTTTNFTNRHEWGSSQARNEDRKRLL